MKDATETKRCTGCGSTWTAPVTACDCGNGAVVFDGSTAPCGAPPETPAGGHSPAALVDGGSESEAATAPPAGSNPDGDRNDGLLDPAAWWRIERTVQLAGGSVQNTSGRWVPAIPLPYLLAFGRTRCGCGEKFRNQRRYREHYALVHVMDLR